MQVRSPLQTILFFQKIPFVARGWLDFCSQCTLCSLASLVHNRSASSRVTLNSHLNKFSRAVRLTIIVGLFVLLPLVITIFSYRKIMQKIRQHNIEARNSLQGLSGTSLHEIRMSRSLFAVVFAFVLCWLPLWIISIFTRLRIVADMPRNIELLCTFCLNLSNTVNPFIYADMNPSFRREFRNILCCESHNSAQATPKSPNKGNSFPNERKSRK